MNQKSRILQSILALIASCAISHAADLGTPDRSDIEYPDWEPHSPEEIELGKFLFFDNRLSLNADMSCATCHNPELGFSDGVAFGQGTMDNKLGRHAPHLYNLAWGTTFFWDGRAGSLEEQAIGPIQAEGEMNMPGPKAEARIRAVPYYQEAFTKIYPDGVTLENIGKAIAAFERTFISDNSAFDRYIAGDKSAMSPLAAHGLELFKGKAQCIDCHSGPNFTDESFHNLGIDNGDNGRGDIVQSLPGAFKTPGLRNIILSAPYMHDGSEKTLEDVVRFYNQGGGPDEKNKSALVKKLNLSEEEIYALVAFMGALTDPVTIERPEIPEGPVVDVSVASK
ncbi:MAG: cytochrome-c peroxidase [Opitutales bacterium]